MTDTTTTSIGRKLPSGWCWAKLEDVFSSITDGDHVPPPQVEEGVPFLVIGNVRTGTVNFSNVRFVTRDYYKSIGEHRTPRKGDLLYTVTGSFGIAVLVDSDQEFCVQRHIAILKPSPGVSARYVSLGLSTTEAYLQAAAAATGTAQKTVGLQRLRQFQVPLSPKAEQHRIVSTVESYFTRLDDAVATLERVERNLKRYRASVLKSAVEGRLVPTEAALAKQEGRDYEPASVLLGRTAAPPRPNRWNSRSEDVIPGHAALAVGHPKTPLPEGWSWSALVDIARMESGHTPSREHPEWWDGDVPWIGIADAREHHGRVINATLQHTNSDGLANSAARLLPPGTVCISRTASVGYVVVMGCAMATSQDFVNWIPSGAVKSDWLRVIFMADREVLRRFGKGSVHKTIYFPEWLSVNIAVPPLKEQVRIVAEVDRLLSVTDGSHEMLNANLRRCERLRQSILKWAFEGKLADQDPSDEPASVLLQRIKAERDKTQPAKKKSRA